MKTLKKLFALLLTLAMVACLFVGCAGDTPATDNTPATNTPATDAPATESGTDDVEPIKIGVLVADVSGEEALAFRSYYENYIASNYNVTFSYTEQLEDAAAEKSAIEKFAAQGCQAILSFSSADRATQLDTCIANGLYYAVASGMLDDAQFETYKGSEYFVGQIGPSMDTEYEAGYAMGKYFADKGVKTVAMYGAFIPNPMHVYRAAGVLAGLGMTYGGASEKDAIVGQIFGDQGIDPSKVGANGVELIGYFQGFGDTTFDELFAMLGQGPDAFLSVGMATTFFTDALNGAGVEFSDIDSFTSANGEAMANGKLVYLAGKYSSSIGPIFAAVVNAVNGHPVRDAEGNALSISQDYLVATDADSFAQYSTTDQGDSPIFSKEVLDTVIGENVSYDDFAALVSADRS
ncbi:MAG: sugar ABC transporter substrate-binding protein [Oscillospiraceae bacterium]|nr:sugar ABC transporter substrate-binding protein [Oscillospiraceae bacterium]